MSKNSFQFLGTGASAGVPLVGCHCPICLSSSPKNRRLRSSGLLRIGGKQLLIDAGPDLRQQALTYQLDRIDALLLTHVHYDHISGLDELRPYNFHQKGAIPCVLSQESLQSLRLRYDYLFGPPTQEAQTDRFTFLPLSEDAGQVEVQGIQLSYFSYRQSGMKVTGYRFGDFAYVTDIRDYASSLFDSLQGVRILVISALRKEPSPVQFSLEEAIEFSQKVGSEQTWITHISHSMEHEETELTLPPNVRMGYDGLHLPI